MKHERVTEMKASGQLIHLKAYVPASVYEAVNKAAYEQHISLSEWVRRAIVDALKGGGIR